MLYGGAVQFYPVCNFGKFFSFGLGTVRSESVKSLFVVKGLTGRSFHFKFVFSLHRKTNQNVYGTVSEDLAEKLYEKVEEKQLGNADVITGMLLELREDNIKLLLNEPRLLDEKIQLSEQALF